MQLVLPCLVVLSALADGGEREFQIAPAPAWVEPLTIDLSPSTEDGAPVHTLLIESQTRVTSDTVEAFDRRATRVLSPSGMDDVSQVELQFDPTYEALTIHEVWIHRGGQKLDALVPSEIKVIQQEKELERRIYNGTRTAVLFLKDIRVGDVVEVASTVTGQNPIMKNQYADRFLLGRGSGIRRVFHRLLYPQGRPIFFKKHNVTAEPTLAMKDGERDYRWDLSKTARVAYEDSLPPWFDPWPWVEVSSFADWSSVAAWAVGLFTPDPASAEDATRADAQVEEWKRTLATPEQRLLAATRFVQDDVRYLGIEMGANSHQPHDPSKVFNQRFGDCKDKALLLVTLLRKLGISADPALVSARRRRGVDADHPWPYAFDHAIVRAELDGRPIWIDGTASLERGKFSTRAPPPFERALLVRPNATALIEIPSAPLDAPTSDVEEKFDVATSGTASLHVRSRYLGSDAHAMRRLVAGMPRDELQKHYLNRYAKDDPAVLVTAPLEIADDLETNTVEVRQHYAFKSFWRGIPRELYPSSFSEALSKPYTSVRTMPLWIAPRNVRHVIEVNLARSQDALDAIDEKTITGPAARATFKLSTTGTLLRLEYTYRTIKDLVEASAIAKHLDSLEQMRQLGVAIPVPATLQAMAPGDELDKTRIRGLLLSAAFFSALIGFFFIYPAFKKKKRPPPKPPRYQR